MLKMINLFVFSWSFVADVGCMHIVADMRSYFVETLMTMPRRKPLVDSTHIYFSYSVREHLLEKKRKTLLYKYKTRYRSLDLLSNLTGKRGSLILLVDDFHCQIMPHFTLHLALNSML